MTETVSFWSWDGHILSVDVEAGGPVSCVRLHDRRLRHHPIGLDKARGRTTPRSQLLGLCYGSRAHELLAEPVDCPDCLAELAK